MFSKFYKNVFVIIAEFLIILFLYFSLEKSCRYLQKNIFI